MTLNEWLRLRSALRSEMHDDARPARFRDIPERMLDRVMRNRYSRDLADLATWKKAAEEAVSRYGLSFVEVAGPIPRLVLLNASRDEEPPQLLALREIREGDE